MKRSPHLPVREWLAVIAILSLMITLTLGITLSQNDHPLPLVSPPHYLIDPEIEVIVEGAVEREGVYRLPLGARLKDLLKQISVLQEADTGKLKLERKLKNGQVVKIPLKKMITVYLTGAVQKDSLRLPKGARLQDLIGLAPFTSDADLSKLRRKRLLKEGETVHIQTLASQS